MAYQETTRQSYGSKVKGSFQGILWGIILILAGTVILWWNEGRAVKASDALKDFQKNYVELSDITTLDPAFEGKAVHATGVAVTADTLRDAGFGIAVNAMKLARRVEYYQWTQKSDSQSKDKLGGSTETTTTYTYEAAWCDEPVNSNEFKDPDYKGKNFVLRAVDPAEQTASNVTFGAYRLTDGIVSRISGEEPAYPSLTEAQKQQLLTNVNDSTVVVTVSGDQVYIGADPTSPRIGDVRITFTQVTSPKTVSLLQKVVNGTFENYIAKNGKEFSKVEMGTVSADNMIEHQKSANKFLLWLFRILGVILVIAGNKSLLGFLSTVFAVVPFVQRIIGTGIGIVATILGLAWSAIVIGVAWIAHRTIVAIALLAVAVVLICWLVSRARKKKTADVVAVLLLVLALGLSAGCKHTDNNGAIVNNTTDGETLVEDLSIAFKGPVESMLVTTDYKEDVPYTVKYTFDQKGKLISKEEYGVDEEFVDDLVEELSEKDAEGRYTKEVWGSEEEGYRTFTYQYTTEGKVAKCQIWDEDGTLLSTDTYSYNAAGSETEHVCVNPQTTYSKVSEYDSQNRIVKSVESYDGMVNTIRTWQYDVDGWDQVEVTEWVRKGRTDRRYELNDKRRNIHAVRSYESNEKGTRLSFADTTYTDANGFEHQRYYYNNDNEYAQEGIFNKKGYLTHYDYYLGNSSQPSISIDCELDADGETLKGITGRRLESGQLKYERKSRYGEWDTFGNWTERALGFQYIPSVSNDEDLREFTNWIITQNRDIHYYGDDQGQDYGFEGKNGDSQLSLHWTNDHGVFCGEAVLDGNPVRIVGVQEKDEEDLHIVALKEDGTIPWHIYIEREGDNRTATVVKGMDEYKIPVTATLKDRKTYRFETTNDQIVGIYEYHDEGGDTGEGTLEVTNPDSYLGDFLFEITNCGPGPSYSTASDSFSNARDESMEYYHYLWDEDSGASYVYRIRFFDGFAVILRERGSAMAFFGMGMSVTGIYAKIPSAG